MMGIGVVFRFLPISHEIRGCVDIAIGSALIQGAFLYFLSAWRSHSPKSTYL